MLKNTLTGLDKNKLRRWLLLFFFALAIPTAILIQQSYSRLKWETFHQHQLLADELSNRIDSEFSRLIEIEEQRSFTDYSFLNIAGNPEANLLQRSPLSKFPVESEIMGLIGYFQVDSEGQLMTPLLPESIKSGKKAESFGISDNELTSRTQLQNQIQAILSQNSLVKNTAPTEMKDKDRDELKKKLPVTKEEGMSSIFGSLMGSSRSENTRSYSPDRASSYADAASVREKKNVQPNAQVAFDQLKTISPKRALRENKLGRLEDLKLDQTYSKELKKQSVKKSKTDTFSKFNKRPRIEQNVLPESELSEILFQHQALSKKRTKAKATTTASVATSNEKITADDGLPVMNPIGEESDKENDKENKQTSNSLRISTFESSIDPFEFSQLDSGHFVLFRNVWLNEQRTIQGLLIDQKPFLENIINLAFDNTSLSQMSDLLVSYQGNVLSVFSAKKISQKTLSTNAELSGELLHQARLSAPLSELQLLFSIKQLPVGSGGKIILWLSFLLASILCVGFYLMYRLGLGQINLANQQQDFVSAVSHELKTPLTSIRMYSEILREGWANDEKKKTYYDFIFDESERLSRLINNVLHLARVTRNKQTVELKNISVAELMDGVQSKVSTQIRQADFEFNINCQQDTKQSILSVDADWFIQIMINLVDNAIKFSSNSSQKKIELSCEKLSNNRIQFSIRDYGPGVDKAQMKKIFKLFYRTESELTRETVGTGIGLALVHQMAVSMNGKIDVVNSNPGAEFRLVFSIASN